MTIRSRLWASLTVALAMILAAGLGVAQPAAADSGTGDLAAADAAELGALLDVEVVPQPDGYIEITKYENATDITMVAADCVRTVRANKPTKTTSRIRGSGHYSISGCGSSPYEVILSIEIYVDGNWLSMHSWNFVTHPPISAEISTGTPCKRGGWSTEINLLKNGSTIKYMRSDVLNVTSC